MNAAPTHDCLTPARLAEACDQRICSTGAVRETQPRADEPVDAKALGRFKANLVETPQEGATPQGRGRQTARAPACRAKTSERAIWIPFAQAGLAARSQTDPSEPAIDAPMGERGLAGLGEPDAGLFIAIADQRLQTPLAKQTPRTSDRGRCEIVYRNAKTASKPARLAGIARLTEIEPTP